MCNKCEVTVASNNATLSTTPIGFTVAHMVINEIFGM